MKIIAEIDCETRHCGRCPVLDAVWQHDYDGSYCTMYKINLRETGRGVLRCKQCMEASRKYKELDAVKTCHNCRKGPPRKCKDIRYCTRGWGKENDLWESEK